MTAGRALLRAAGAAWPALPFYLGMWPAGLAGAWTAVWMFFFSGTVLAVTLWRARYLRGRARLPYPRQPVSAKGTSL